MHSVAYSHTTTSSALASPTSRTCTESAYRSTSERTSRGARFWSKISLTPPGSGSRNGDEPALAICSERKTCADIVAVQVGKIRENFFFGHAGWKVLEHVIDGDPQAAYARFSTPPARLERDDALVIHPFNLWVGKRSAKHRLRTRVAYIWAWAFSSARVGSTTIALFVGSIATESTSIGASESNV